MSRPVDARLARIREALSEVGAAALLVTAPANVRWASRFASPEDGRLLVAHDDAWLFTDGRYTAQAEEQSVLPVVIERDWIAAVGEHLPAGSLAVEAEHLTLAGADALRERLDVELAPTKELLARLRLHKDEEELACVRRAAAIGDAALREGLERLGPGVPEVEVALAIEQAMRRAGAEGPAFDTVVASGPRGGMPHGIASMRRIEDGELVTIDLGARFGGYCADMTRTVAVGTAGEEERRWHAAVAEAQEVALAAVAPGVPVREVDAAARRSLAEHDLADAFVHSLGHGVGLEVHEAPRLSARSDEVLAPGMVVTIEPGVYRPGRGGVRIEDLVLVTEHGCEILSHAPKPPLG